jgi:hypothetical protein
MGKPRITSPLFFFLLQIHHYPFYSVWAFRILSVHEENKRDEKIGIKKVDIVSLPFFSPSFAALLHIKHTAFLCEPSFNSPFHNLPFFYYVDL